MKIKPLHSLLLLLALVLAPKAKAGFSFVAGDYYTSNYFSNVITQYDLAGSVVGSITLPSSYGSEVRGLTFGADGLLYATLVTSSGYSVLALNSAGIPQQTYSGSVYVAGDAGYGKITIAGQYLYVAGQDQLTRFLLGDPSSGTVIYTNNQVFDTKPLPNGNLLVASAYRIDEITTSGTFVRTIPLLGGGGNSYTDIQGIEYNADTNELFVSELGHSGFFFQVLRQNATTGLLEKSTTFNYANDLFLTISGQLLVGSASQIPRLYDQDLNQTGTLGGGQQTFVTQLVPEPSSSALIALASLATAALAVRRPRHRKDRSPDLAAKLPSS